jgi:hypothetical protein
VVENPPTSRRNAGPELLLDHTRVKILMIMQRTNEHYLPRLLLKGFRSRGVGDEVKTWWFRQGKTPLEINIKNIAAEKDFHTSSTGVSADEAIRDLEDRFGPYIQFLRNETRQLSLDDAIVPELCANLSVRTKAFRDEMIRSAKFGIYQTIARLREPERLKNFAAVILGDPNCQVLNALITNLRARFSPERAEAMVAELFNNFDFLSSPLAQLLINAQLEKLEISLETDFLNVAKDSHVAALSETPAPDTVIEALAHLRWHLVIRNRGSFILGDVGPVFKIEGRSEARGAPIGTYQYDAAFLPIADSHLIAGFESTEGNLNADDVNRLSASCSQHFFVSAFNTSKEQCYSEHLGATREFLDKNTLDLLLSLFRPNDP